MTKVALRLTDAGFHRTLVLKDRRFSNGIAKVLLFSEPPNLFRLSLHFLSTQNATETPIEGHNSLNITQEHPGNFSELFFKKIPLPQDC